MIGNLSHVMTLANGIIGVSVLAMPFCFKQCGIVLATLVLLVSSVLSRLASHFLIKSAVMSRRRNFEFLALHAFGRPGKFLAELSIIGFLIGTCIAFFVVVGDLGPQIVAKMFDKQPEDIRTSLMATTATFIVFPLGLLRNIDSLASVCTATIGFYLCLILKVMTESTRHILLGDWYDRVAYWRPAGILQCLPIFAMALFCQTQLFEIYEAVPNACLEKMNRIVRGALNICTVVYLFVGFFGYIAFCTQPFTGNILMSFEPSLTSDLIKIGFVLSVAFSFPLAIFPCRASLNSLLFRRGHTHEPGNYYIPEVRFRWLTLTIVAVSLGTGILMPNIEFVLGIVGSTIGVMICLIFPAAFFISISTKNTNERLLAQAILFFGMWIMVLGTYANLYAMDESSNARILLTTEKIPHPIVDIIFSNDINNDFPKDPERPTREPYKEIQRVMEKRKKMEPRDDVEKIDVRREPPIPVELTGTNKKLNVKINNFNGNVIIDDPLPRSIDDVKIMNGQQDVVETVGTVEKKLEKAIEIMVNKPNEPGDQRRYENLIDSDAIKKEESELAAAADAASAAGDDAARVNDNGADDAAAAAAAAARHKKFRLTLENHELEQRKMIQEQKELLKDIKEVMKQKRELEMMKNRLTDDENTKNNDNKKINTTEELSGLPNNSVDRVVDRNNDEPKIIGKNQQSSNSKDLSSVNQTDKWHGPILNALTNRTLAIDSSKSKKSHDHYSMPNDLKITNETNVIVPTEKQHDNSVSSDPEIMIVRRDILERVDRKKRETNENSTGGSSDVINNDENCRHKDEKSSNFITRVDNETKTANG